MESLDSRMVFSPEEEDILRMSTTKRKKLRNVKGQGIEKEIGIDPKMVVKKLARRPTKFDSPSTTIALLNRVIKEIEKGKGLDGENENDFMPSQHMHENESTQKTTKVNSEPSTQIV
ncbi:hypothetical protein RJT34_12060 [Clitoria ternatea]|uniref:Uncharacterized protein n=1 Tax=Clitoria ternatea TaxID=43366 RepID=A0AAN9JN36_CLITE